MKSYFTSAARALATSFANVFRKPVTVEFPKVIRPRAERYRASFALLHEEDGDEACIGCLQCERICPSQVISIKAGGKRESPISGKKRGYADDFVLDLNACIYCELCVQVCPTDAIVMTREPELPAFGREDLVLTMAKLYANEKSKHRAWGDATRLNGMQVAPKPPAAAKPAAAPAPAAASGSPVPAASGAPANAASPAAAPVASPAAAPPASGATASPAGPPGADASAPSAPVASAGAPPTRPPASVSTTAPDRAPSASTGPGAAPAAPGPGVSPAPGPAPGATSSSGAPPGGPAAATSSGTAAPPSSKLGEGES